MSDVSETTRLSSKSRDSQYRALRLQQEEIAPRQRHWEHAERINDRAEALQQRSGGAIVLTALPLLAPMSRPRLSVLAA